MDKEKLKTEFYDLCSSLDIEMASSIANWWLNRMEMAMFEQKNENIKKIERMIKENAHINNYYDTAKEIINLIKK